jgi:hypothetical protein
MISGLMKLILANPRGFCAGVNMAIDTLETAIRLYGTPIHVFHEIVHNKHVVDRFTREGAVFVDTVEEVPEGAQGGDGAPAWCGVSPAGLSGHGHAHIVAPAGCALGGDNARDS